MRTTWLIILSLFTVACLSGAASAKDEVGSVIAVRGNAFIERDGSATKAKVKDGLLLKDSVSTREASRAKMLFKDDSVLTLGERSRVVIKEFLLGKDKGSRSLFNLLDGKMRAVVGRAGFEVRTPTATAAARGTIILFETGEINGRKFTRIICLEGVVLVSGADVRPMETVSLSPGQSITVWEGEALPSPARATEEEERLFLKEMDFTDYEISIPGPMNVNLSEIRTSGWSWWDNGILPPIEQQPAKTTTPVTIGVIFP